MQDIIFLKAKFSSKYNIIKVKPLFIAGWTAEGLQIEINASFDFENQV